MGFWVLAAWDSEQILSYRNIDLWSSSGIQFWFLNGCGVVCEMNRENMIV